MSTVPDRAPEFVTYDYAHIMQGSPPCMHSSQHKQSDKLSTGFAECTLPAFHNAPPIHVHRHCKNCKEASRCEDIHLRKCKGCYMVYYCSKACQRACWASHRDECKWYSDVRRDVTAETKGPQAWKDLCAWIEFLYTSLVNCAVASFNLPKNPGSEKYTTFCIDIHYCNEPGQRMEQRFCLKDMSVVDSRNPEKKVPGINSETMAGEHAVVEAGKRRYGEDYAGTGMICLTADFNTMFVDFPPIMFTIDKTVACAERRPGWNAFLHDYVCQGKKMRFCCRKSEGGCCCGGRARERDADNQHFNKNLSI